MMATTPSFILLVVLASFVGVDAKAKVVIEAMKHDIQQITPQNFDGVISKFRDNAVSALWLFKDDEQKDADFFDAYNKLAGDLKGMMKISALSCSEHPLFCKKLDVKDTPHVMIYPPNPIPAFKYEGKLETKGLQGKLARFLTDMSTKLTKENVDGFLTTDVTKPKVILFSKSKTTPTIWKALSSEVVFQRTIKFGFVSEDDKDIVSKFKVTKFPTVIMQRGAKSEVKETYKGELTFLGLKDFVNLHSESGMGDKIHSSGGKEEVSIEEAKPWLVQEVPELTGKSQGDICFKGEGLCVIYLQDGEASAKETDMLSSLSKSYTSQLGDRGAKMKWMWLNMKLEPAYKELFNPPKYPSTIVFNPHKRLRFTMMDHGEDSDKVADEQSIKNLMEKVLGGDARFTMVKGQKLPSWANRDADKGKKEL
jgi:hypothetical protein